MSETNRIGELLEARGWTHRQLATAIGTTQATISRLCIGKQALTVEWMHRIADALDVRPRDLLDEPQTSSFSISYENGAVVVNATLMETKSTERLIAQLDRIREQMEREESQRKDKVVSLRSLPPKAENGGN